MSLSRLRIFQSPAPAAVTSPEQGRDLTSVGSNLRNYQQLQQQQQQQQLQLRPESGQFEDRSQQRADTGSALSPSSTVLINDNHKQNQRPERGTVCDTSTSPVIYAGYACFVREIFYILDISLYTYYLLQDSLSPLTGAFAQQQVDIKNLTSSSSCACVWTIIGSTIRKVNSNEYISLV